MEDRRNHRAAVAVLGAILVAGTLAQPLWAEEPLPPYKPPPTVVVTTEPDAAVVEAETAASTPGRTPTNVTGRRKCYLEPDTANIGFANNQMYAEAARRGEQSFYLYCDGEYVGLVWRKIDTGPEPSSSVTPREVAMHLREEIPIPRVTISVNPEMGLVGTESWFWIDGYSGEEIEESTDAFGQLVQIEASVTHYGWAFGDGESFTSTSPGRAYPEESEIRHIYERSSAGTQAGYPIEVTFQFAVRYRVGAGDWTELPPITRSTSFRYQVRESQAVISR